MASLTFSPSLEVVQTRGWGSPPPANSHKNANPPGRPLHRTTSSKASSHGTGDTGEQAKAGTGVCRGPPGLQEGGGGAAGHTARGWGPGRGTFEVIGKANRIVNSSKNNPSRVRFPGLLPAVEGG